MNDPAINNTSMPAGLDFDTVLIANRGEIACRVIRSAQALGYRCVAVFSEADREAPHVAAADLAVHLGPAPAAQSYLHIDALLQAARRSGAQAVHPGYGFLSERADFAAACEAAGLVFIGPPATAMRAMGDKAGAKRRMLAAGVPCLPGFLGEPDQDPDDATLEAAARDLGWPLLVKAVAGGGGRGMRLVQQADALRPALQAARREAESAFGDGRLMLERLVHGGRHIEIQVFADAHGQVLHLGERDCSTQRRRQKVIEEAPSPRLGAAQREAMGRDAVAAARAVGYRGAGTVEFIVDAHGQHYFLEMNTRLQVEHPVTEAVTGLDLVAWQLRVARGEPLPLRQEQVRWHGHAIEARLYAEDPYDGFAPQTGTVLHWQPDLARARQPGLRIDAGIATGSVVTPYYDALLAKLIVHGSDRADATRRLARALDDCVLLGLRHNGRFLRDLLRHPAFAAAEITTATLDDWCAGGAALLQRPSPSAWDWAVAAAACIAPAHRPAGLAVQGLTLRCADAQRALRVHSGAGSVQVDIPEDAAEDGSAEDRWQSLRLRLQPLADGRCAVLDEAAAADGRPVMREVVHLLREGPRVHLARGAAVFVFEEPAAAQARAETGADARRVLAPLAGLVAQRLVAPGDAVAAGQALLSIEAMKMEMWLHAPRAGRVRAVHRAVRDTVAAGDLLVELDPDPLPPTPPGPGPAADRS